MSMSKMVMSITRLNSKEPVTISKTVMRIKRLNSKQPIIMGKTVMSIEILNAKKPILMNKTVMSIKRLNTWDPHVDEQNSDEYLWIEYLRAQCQWAKQSQVLRYWIPRSLKCYNQYLYCIVVVRRATLGGDIKLLSWPSVVFYQHHMHKNVTEPSGRPQSGLTKPEKKSAIYQSYGLV